MNSTAPASERPSRVDAVAWSFAGLSLLLMPGLVALSSILSMNAFDVLCWAACTLVVIRILESGTLRSLWPRVKQFI